MPERNDISGQRNMKEHKNEESVNFTAAYRLITEEFFFSCQGILDTEIRDDILHYLTQQKLDS
jgi:hypothetical protein